MITHLPGNSITSHGRYSAIPEPLKKLERSLHSCVLGFGLRSVLLLALLSEGLPLWYHRCADEEYVTFARCNILVLEYCEECGEVDGVS